jgi:hypothetical protein
MKHRDLKLGENGDIPIRNGDLSDRNGMEPAILNGDFCFFGYVTGYNYN